MKKVLLIWPYFHPDPGAASVRGRAFQKYLSEDFEVGAITRDNAKTDYQSGDGVMRLPLSLSYSPISMLSDYRKMRRAIASHSPDVMIVSIPPPVLSFISVLAAKRLGVGEIILDCRDLPSNMSGIKKQLRRLVDKYSYTNAHRVFVTTEVQKQETIDKFSVDDSTVDVVPNGVDLDTVPNNTVDEKDIDLVFLGSLNPERDLSRLGEYLGQLIELRPEARIVFVGFDPKSESAKSFRDNLPESVGIEFISEVSHQQVWEMLFRAKLGLHSVVDHKDLAYQLPVKIFEYMAAGLGVVVLGGGQNTQLSRLIQDNGIGYLETDPRKLAEVTANLLDNHDELNRLSRNNIEKVKPYDRKTITRKVNALLK